MGPKARLAGDGVRNVPAEVCGSRLNTIRSPQSAMAMAHPRVKQRLTGRIVARTVFVPGSLLNIVTGPEVSGP